MEHQDGSPLHQLKQVERQVRVILLAGSNDDPIVRKAAQAVLHTMNLARKVLTDYEIEEDVRRQAKLLPLGLERLELLRKNILDASQKDVFSPVDVAQLTSTIDQLIERLR